MTLWEFLSDRQDRILIQAVCAAGAFFFLRATGTQSGVLAILLLALLLVFAAVQLSDFLRQRARLRELESILEGLRITGVRYEAEAENPSYHPGRCARICRDGTTLGVLGQIHPHVAENYGVDCALYAAELHLDVMCQCAGCKPLYCPLPRFPAVTRDISVVCGREIPVAALEDCIRRGAQGLLKKVTLFDIYTGTGIPEDKKSVAFSLELRSDDRSLTAEEADADVKSILDLLKSELDAVLR